MIENVKENVFSTTPFSNLSITFDWRLKIPNKFLERKLNLISQVFLVQNLKILLDYA